ncbi:membrane protein FAM174A-like [Ischnura elegans]|uniref:membrane protein FAM174A-like n=1 Tax=Ischnura elegans TaxID=197161 RepID=UPI001ED87869|nr:membrane protein FAM174A-like [Ischnura elegans]
MDMWWNFAMFVKLSLALILVCTPALGEDKVISGNLTSPHAVISEVKALNSSTKSNTTNETSNGFTSVVETKNRSVVPVVPAKPKPVDTSVSRNNGELKSNATLDGTWRRNSTDSMNFGALLRGFYVFLGLSVIVIMYFTVRAIRLGRKKTKVKKYGILASREDVEMTPLGVDDDEEDNTIFDISSHPGQ